MKQIIVVTKLTIYIPVDSTVLNSNTHPYISEVQKDNVTSSGRSRGAGKSSSTLLRKQQSMRSRGSTASQYSTLSVDSATSTASKVGCYRLLGSMVVMVIRGYYNNGPGVVYLLIVNNCPG